VNFNRFNKYLPYYKVFIDNYLYKKPRVLPSLPRRLP